MKQKKIFLSHASKDKALADRLTDLLTAGCAVNPNDILCTTLEGKGIPAGTPSFIEYLRQQIQEPHLVILLLSENFFASAFCLCELGAVWGMELPNFPLVVPPLDKGKLKATLAVTQAGNLTSASYLDELRDVIKDKIETSVPTPTWNVKRDAFLQGLEELLESLPAPVTVPSEKLIESQSQYKAALAEIADRDKRINALKSQISELERCKDIEEVKAVERKYSSSQQQFEKLIANARAALMKVSRATRVTLFFEERGEQFTPRGRDEWDEAREALHMEEIEIYETWCQARSEHIKVQKAKEALAELDNFLEHEANTELVRKLEAEKEFPVALKNKEFWQSFLQIHP